VGDLVLIRPRGGRQEGHGCELSGGPDLCTLDLRLDPAGWKLLRVDEIISLSLLPEPVPAPRPDYRRGDKDIWLTFCQL